MLFSSSEKRTWCKLRSDCFVVDVKVSFPCEASWKHFKNSDGGTPTKYWTVCFKFSSRFERLCKWAIFYHGLFSSVTFHGNADKRKILASTSLWWFCVYILCPSTRIKASIPVLYTMYCILPFYCPFSSLFSFSLHASEHLDGLSPEDNPHIPKPVHAVISLLP